eukprot:3904690-Rhodomonas_salina.2
MHALSVPLFAGPFALSFWAVLGRTAHCSRIRYGSRVNGMGVRYGSRVDGKGAGFGPAPWRCRLRRRARQASSPTPPAERGGEPASAMSEV